MDDQQLLELLTQIAELAGVGVDALTGANGGPAADGDEKMPPEGQAPPA